MQEHVANMCENSEANLIHKHYRYTVKNTLITLLMTKQFILQY